MSAVALPFGLGLIEGFYGRAWPDCDRLSCVQFLAKCGYRYYVYAPKGDQQLRRHWRENWGAEGEQRIRELAAACHASGVTWGVGLSPLGLVEDLSPENLRHLRRKVGYLDQFNPGIVSILFDDMPRGIDDLAAAQLEVIAEVRSITRAPHVLVCPSYYSTDPVLERLFGPMPDGYWAALGKGLPRDVGVFWTGDKVCSTQYRGEDLQAITEHLQRKPVLWDNYPVNDGAKMAGYLHLDAFRGRPAQLGNLVQAHFVNPMNQCWLSRIPLASLPHVYADGCEYDPGRVFQCGAREHGGAVGAMLAEDLKLLQQVGLQAMTDSEKAYLHGRYTGQDSAFASELLEWLDGRYAFDPACLTD